jgi:hypothetical protein
VQSFWGIAKHVRILFLCIAKHFRICQVLYLDYFTCLKFYFNVLLNEGSCKATRRRVNRSRIKFFCKNRHLSQVQYPKPKHCNKVMNILTNSIEMIPSKLWMQRKMNGINWTHGYQDMAKTVIERQAESLSRTLSDWSFLELKTEVRTLFGSCQTLSGVAKHCPVGGIYKTWFSPKAVLSTQVWFLSYTAPKWIKFGHKGYLNTRRNSWNQRGLETWIHSKVGWKYSENHKKENRFIQLGDEIHA